MHAGSTYRHCRSRDVDMLVVKVRQRSATHLYLHVRWINRRSRNLFTRSVDVVKVKRADLKNWEFVE